MICYHVLSGKKPSPCIPSLTNKPCHPCLLAVEHLERKPSSGSMTAAAAGGKGAVQGEHRWGAPWGTQVALLFRRSLRTRRFQASVTSHARRLLLGWLAGGSQAAAEKVEPLWARNRQLASAVPTCPAQPNQTPFFAEYVHSGYYSGGGD